LRIRFRPSSFAGRRRTRRSPPPSRAPPSEWRRWKLTARDREPHAFALAGIEAAKLKGIYKGHPATFDRARIVSLRKEGMGATEIANAVGCKRGNVYKTLKAAGLN
jgi:hypothetical protein